MSTSTLTLAAAEGNQLSQPLSLPANSGTTYTHAVRGMRFVIADPNQPGQPAQLEGIDEDGKAHTWVTGDELKNAENIEENEQAFLILSSDANTAAPLFIPTHESGMWMAIAAFAGLLGLGGIVLSMQNQHSGPGESPPPPPTIDVAEDDIGIYTGIHTSGGLTDDANPTFSGAGTVPGNIIFLYADGELLGSTLVNTDGSWTLISDIALSHGKHSITATEVSTSGLVSGPSIEFLLNVDLIAPSRPLVTSIEDNSGIFTGVLSSGAITDDNLPLFSGTAEPGALITFSMDGIELSSTVVDGSGNWTWRPDVAIEDGIHRFTAQVTDLAGNIGLPSQPFIFTVDTLPPDPPIVISAVDNMPGGIEGNDIGNNGLTNDPRPVFSGTAEAHSLVSIIDNRGEVIASFTVDSNGNWNWQPDVAFEQGLQQLSFIAQDAAGNLSAPSAPFSFTVDTLAPATPAIISALDNVNGGVQDGDDIGNNGLTNDARPVLKGTAEASSLLRIINAAGTVLASVHADTQGKWSWQPTSALPENLNTFTVTAEDAAGNLSAASATYSFTVDTLAPATPAIISALDNVNGGVQDGNDIGNNGLTNDARPVLKGTAEAGSLVRIINAAGTVLASVHADTQGKWSWQPASALPENLNTLTVTAEDAAGNLSAASATYSFTVDTLAPATPAIISTLDSVNGGVQDGNDIGNNGITNDARPVLKGTAEAGSLVRIINAAGTVLASVHADTQGKYTISRLKFSILRVTAVENPW